LELVVTKYEIDLR